MDSELDCIDCSGAGFFGDSGPYVHFCQSCLGTGKVVEGSAYRFMRKPLLLAESADGNTDSQLRAGRKRA